MVRFSILSLFLLSSLNFVANAAGLEAGYTGLTPQRQAELVHLLKNDCGSCHGITLKGSLGPSLLPQALASRSTGELRAVILNGVPGTPMPPWRGQLSDADTTFLVNMLQHGVPRE